MSYLFCPTPPFFVISFLPRLSTHIEQKQHFGNYGMCVVTSFWWLNLFLFTFRAVFGSTLTSELVSITKVILFYMSTLISKKKDIWSNQYGLPLTLIVIIERKKNCSRHITHTLNTHRTHTSLIPHLPISPPPPPPPTRL